MTGSAAELTLIVPPSMAGIRIARDVVRAALRAVDAPARECEDIAVAVSEACSNVVAHARDSRNFVVTVTVDPTLCTVEVVDRGIGFVPAAGEPQAPPLTAESGRGLFLIASIADRSDVTSAPGQGTRVRISKRLGQR